MTASTFWAMCKSSAWLTNWGMVVGEVEVLWSLFRKWLGQTSCEDPFILILATRNTHVHTRKNTYTRAHARAARPRAFSPSNEGGARPWDSSWYQKTTKEKVVVAAVVVVVVVVVKKTYGTDFCWLTFYFGPSRAVFSSLTLSRRHFAA
jgi:hypothetical protein